MTGLISFSARIFLAVLIACAVLAIPPAVPVAVAAAPVPRILLLNSYNIGYDWSDAEIQGFTSALSRAYERYELFIEHLDTKKFYGKTHFPREADLLEAKYRDAGMDVIIAMDNAAFEFARQFRERLFPGLPLVRKGFMYPNDQPGLGIDIDEALAAKYPCTDTIEGWTQTRLPDGTPARP